MSGSDSRKRRHLNTTTTTAVQPTGTPIAASQRVLTSPELLSLIFGFLVHTDVAPSEGEGEDTELSSFQRAECSCPCRQCVRESAGVAATAVISLPSPFAIPLKEKPQRRGKERDEDEPRPAVCHCQLPTHGQLSTLFGKSTNNRKATETNRPSYNLANALVCKRWSSVALDALWRVLDRPECLFALLDGSWGAKLPPNSPGIPGRLKGLRGLHRSEWGEGRMPAWWEPGVEAFLKISDDESDDEGDTDTNEDGATPPHRLRRREFELFSFRSAPTPASWGRFDRYAKRVRHLVYTRPCLSESALNQIAVSRPRLVVLPRMHALSWADNPLHHAVLFMHAGVTRLELRIQVFGREKTDPHASPEQALNTYNDLGLNGFTFSEEDDGAERMVELFGLDAVKPNRSITRTLATQLAEIPRRMPNIQFLCISSFISVSLYLPALLCTLLRPPTPTPSVTLEEDTIPPPIPSLRKLRRLVLPRYYTCGPLLDSLSRFPELQVIEYQFDHALGWGRPYDVGLGRCVPKGWKRHEARQKHADGDEGEETRRHGWFGSLAVRRGKAAQSASWGDTSNPDGEDLKGSSLSPASNTTFPKLYDLSITVPLTDARDLFLSAPITEAPAAEPSDPSSVSPTLPSTSLTRDGLPSWPQSLVCLFLETPPGFIASPKEIRSLVHAIALACYGPSTPNDCKPARLERLNIVCSADSDSGYDALTEVDDDYAELIGNERNLSRKTIEPLLELFPGTGQPRFALKSFEITHYRPFALTQEDVEVIAERWGGCIEKLVLSCEPVAAFGITDVTALYETGALVGSLEGQATDRPAATLTLAALLPFARYCTELRHLGLFVDASRGVRGLMEPVFSRDSGTKFESRDSSNAIDAFTCEVARRYLKDPLSHPSIPNAFPVFRKLERLNLGTSVMSISLEDLDLQFPSLKDSGDAEDGEGDGSNTGQPGSEEKDSSNDGTDKAQFLSAMKDAARARMEDKDGVVDEGHGREEDEENVPQSADAIFMDYLRRSGVRLGLVEEDQFESELQSATWSQTAVGGALQDYDASSLVPLFLAQVLPCFPSQQGGGSSSAFTTMIEAGTICLADPSTFMASSWAVEKYWTVGEPFELWKKDLRRKKRQKQQVDEEREVKDSTGVADVDTGAVPLSPEAAPSNEAEVPTDPSSTLVVPFYPPSPLFAEPAGFLPRILSAVLRARAEKCLKWNESVLPTAVAMREGGWMWGGRVAKELGKTQSEVDELQVRVEVMDGLTQARSRGRKNEAREEEKGPDGCVIC